MDLKYLATLPVENENTVELNKLPERDWERSNTELIVKPHHQWSVLYSLPVQCLVAIICTCSEKVLYFFIESINLWLRNHATNSHQTMHARTLWDNSFYHGKTAKNLRTLGSQTLEKSIKLMPSIQKWFQMHSWTVTFSKFHTSGSHRVAVDLMVDNWNSIIFGHSPDSSTEMEKRKSHSLILVLCEIRVSCDDKLKTVWAEQKQSVWCH